MSTSEPSPDREAPGATAAPGPVRSAVERASRPALLQLARLPVWLPFLALLLLILGGGILGGTAGWILVGVALAFVGWLFYLSWPRLTGVERLMRVSVLLLFLAVTVVQLVPRG
ncbi:hypothetical protein AVL62_09150 [Serinicoccus chungangensis]|uniref:Uncharacterized protein n=1 Tax=Serinicoccus chungangensis TaxID=767452 RepID=A0A0W8I1A3_9MICO|nr:DUF6703 family protein [Serinicoccus chungangensis]KUG51496.1 hypothetical protein AVL62_09150 [Serinicoccus chungangensis]